MAHVLSLGHQPWSSGNVFQINWPIRPSHCVDSSSEKEQTSPQPLTAAFSLANLRHTQQTEHGEALPPLCHQPQLNPPFVFL